MIHDDRPHVHWKLAVIEKISKGGGFNQSAEVRSEQAVAKLNRLIAKLYPLEVTDDSTTFIQNTTTDMHRSLCSSVIESLCHLA